MIHCKLVSELAAAISACQKPTMTPNSQPPKNKIRQKLIRVWPRVLQVTYSTDLVTWTMMEGTFKANKDTSTAVGHILAPAIVCRYLRFTPVAWNQHIALRVEIYGKEADCTSANRR